MKRHLKILEFKNKWSHKIYNFKFNRYIQKKKNKILLQMLTPLNKILDIKTLQIYNKNYIQIYKKNKMNN